MMPVRRPLVIPPGQVLGEAATQAFLEVVVIGRFSSGELYVASSHPAVDCDRLIDDGIAELARLTVHDGDVA